MSRLHLDVNVSPLKVSMAPENNHIEEGGKISVTCTATDVSFEVFFTKMHYDLTLLAFMTVLWLILLSVTKI